MTDQPAPKPTTKPQIDWEFLERAMPSPPSLAGQRRQGTQPAKKKTPPMRPVAEKSTVPPGDYPSATRTTMGWALCHHGDEVGFPRLDLNDPAIGIDALELKALMKLRMEPYRPNAVDGDNDGIVQEHTAWERPAGTRLVDKAGKAIREGLMSHQRPEGLRVVDVDGKTVDYTPTYAPKAKPIPGTISRAPRLGRTIGETMSAGEALRKVTAREPDELDQVEAVELWLTGTTKPLRKYIDDIMEGPASFDRAHEASLGGLNVPSMELLFKTRYARYRRSMAALMNLIAEGDTYDEPKKPLWRGYYLQTSPEDALNLLQVGSVHDFPVRSFSEQQLTATGFVEKRLDQSPGGTGVLFKLTGSVQTANLHEWGAAIQEQLRAEIPADERAKMGHADYVQYPFTPAAYDFLTGETEHLVMGSFEVVDVHWDTELDAMVVEIKQVSTLGLPEGGGKWR